MPSRLTKLPLRLPSTTTPSRLDALGPEREVGPLHRLVDPERVVHVTQIRRHQTVVALHAVEQEGPFGIGRGADGRSGPIDRRPGQRPVVRIADRAPYVLRPERAARGDEKKMRLTRNIRIVSCLFWFRSAGKGREKPLQPGCNLPHPVPGALSPGPSLLHSGHSPLMR